MTKRARLTTGDLNQASLGTTRLNSGKHKKARFPSHIIGAFAKYLCMTYGEYDNRDDAIVERYLAVSRKTAQLAIDRTRPGRSVSEYNYAELTEVLANETNELSDSDNGFSGPQALKEDALFRLYYLFIDTPELRANLFNF